MFGQRKQDRPEGLVLHDEETARDEEGEALCAWCLGEQGIVPQSGTHGICLRHRDAMLRDHQAYRARRRGGR